MPGLKMQKLFRRAFSEESLQLKEPSAKKALRKPY